MNTKWHPSHACRNASSLWAITWSEFYHDGPKIELILEIPLYTTHAWQTWDLPATHGQPKRHLPRPCT